MTNKKRTESDSLGIKKIDSKRMWGAQTQRSLENFKISNDKMPKEIIIALGKQKKAAALANQHLGLINKNLSNAIVKACDEVINLNLLNEFPLSVWQTGSGTQTNMNANEVISNKAIQILGGVLGSKSPVHPNDHCNKSQSSNDTFPTAMHIACAEIVTKSVIPSLKNLHKELSKKVKLWDKIIKIGRTHLQDATPLSLGQEFSGYQKQIEFGIKRVELALIRLKYLAQGGTAVGTGLNTKKSFSKLFASNVSKFTGINFKTAENKYEAIATHDAMVEMSGMINTVAVSLHKIANDIRLLGSGPRSGLGELNLPENEPGSSIMPGKVNPTQCEALTMVCAQIIGNHTTISFSGSQGHMELNAYKPVILYNLIQSMQLLSDSVNSFTTNCLIGITPNKKNIKQLMEKSLMLVTALVPQIGYDNATKVAKLAHKEGLTLKEAAVRYNFISENSFDKIVKPEKMIKPSK